MRKIFLLLFVLAMLLLMAAAPFPQTDPGGIPAGLIVILSSVLIPVVIQALKWIAAGAGVIWKEKTLMIICFALAVVVALLWLMPSFPEFPLFDGDPADVTNGVLDWISGALSVVGSLFGLATLIYQFILQAVFRGLGVGTQALRIQANKS